MAPRQILFQETSREDKSVFALLWEVGEVRGVWYIPKLVFVLHRDAAIKADLQQDGEECRPVDNPLSGNPITPPSLSRDAHLLHTLAPHEISHDYAAPDPDVLYRFEEAALEDGRLEK